MAFIAPDIDSDQLATLMANPGRAAALAQTMQALGGPAVLAPGTTPPANPAPAPAPTPVDPSPKLWESGVGSPVPTSPVPAVAPAGPVPSYQVPVDMTTRPQRPPVASLENPMPPAPWAVGATPPAAPPPLASPSPIDSLIASRPTQDPTAQNKMKADMAARTAAVSDRGNQPRWYERLGAGLSAGAVMYGTHNAEEAARAGAAFTDRRMNNALRPIDANIAADQQQIGQNQSDFENKRQSYEDALKGIQAQGLLGEREAKAQKYENAIDPKSLRQDEDGKWIGTTYGGEQVDAGAPSSATTAAAKDPVNKIKANLLAADQLGLKGADRIYFGANSKLREPNPDLEARLAEMRQRDSESQTNHADHEADVAATRDANAIARHQAALAQYSSKKNDISQKEQGEYDKLEAGFQKQFTAKDVTPEKQDALTKDHEAKKAQIQQRYTQMYNQLGPEPELPQPSGGAAPPARAGRAAAAQSANKPPVASNPPAANSTTTVRMKGPDGKLWDVPSTNVSKFEANQYQRVNNGR